MMSQEGLAFKQHMLTTMGQDPNRHATLWGCQEGGVRSAIGDWSPHAAWADARAILSTAAHFERNALVVDLESRTFVYIAPNGDTSRRTWILHFKSDHYSPAVAQDHGHLAGIVGKISLSPWNPTTLMRGGGIALDPWYDMDTNVEEVKANAPAIAVPHLTYHQWRDALHEWAAKTVENTELQEVSGEGDLLLHTLNLGGSSYQLRLLSHQLG